MVGAPLLAVPLETQFWHPPELLLHHFLFYWETTGDAGVMSPHMWCLERSIQSQTQCTYLFAFFPSFVLTCQTNKKDFRQQQTYNKWKLSHAFVTSLPVGISLRSWDKMYQLCQLLLRKWFVRMSMSEDELCLLALWHFPSRPQHHISWHWRVIHFSTAALLKRLI